MPKQVHKVNATVIFNIVFWVLLAILLLGAVLMIVRVVNNNREQFGVYIDGKEVVNGDDIELGKEIVVKGTEKYMVQIEDRYPANMAIVYRVSGGTNGLYNDPELYSSSYIEDWTMGFNIVKNNGSFTVENTSLLQVLVKIHNNSKIELSGDGFSVPSSDYGKFALVISSGNNEITLNFSIPIGG